MLPAISGKLNAGNYFDNDPAGTAVVAIRKLSLEQLVCEITPKEVKYILISSNATAGL
jgi:hypothetical protein